MSKIRFLVLYPFILSIILVIGCANESPRVATGDELPGTHRFDLTLGPATVATRLAVTQQEMARGLMGVTALGVDEGMLFVYPRPIEASFWMRNTPLPLDIGFFDQAGVLLEVYAMFPFDETPVKSRSQEVLLALEVNQGWFSRNRIRPGAVLDLDQLRQALRDRGFDQSAFTL
jgi:uncharacterized membrane protein (UPF0127 family)